jgi:hypothetical protein
MLLVAAVGLADPGISPPAPSKPLPADLLQRRVAAFRFDDGSVLDVVERLRKVDHLPISLIEAKTDQPRRFALSVADATLQELLNLLVSKDDHYQYRRAEGRLFVFPREPRYELLVRNVAIEREPRLTAAEKYATKLRSEFEAFQDLSGPMMKGEANAPLYRELVSLQGDGTPIEHFGQLLAVRPAAYISVLRTKSRMFVILFGEV